MPSTAENKRLALVVSAKCVLISFAATLFLLGTFATVADEVGSPTAPISRIDKNNPPPNRHSPPISGPLNNGKFFESLRFWEKIKSPPQSKPPAATQPQPVPTRPQEVLSGTANRAPSTAPAAVGTPAAPIPHSPAIGLSAPEPSMDTYTEGEKTYFGDAPLPAELFTNRSREPDAGSSQDAKPPVTSHLSYSFDSRDWVDFFPLRQENAFSQENTTAVTQPASLRSPLPNTQQYQSEDKDNQWDGQATGLISHDQRAPFPTAATAVTSSAEGLVIDLTPSYVKRLPHTQTCGVVVVQANFPLTEIASILEEINQLQYDLNRYIGVPAPKEKIELCLFRNEETYLRFLQEFFPRAPRDRRALYVKLDNKPGTLLVQQSKDFEIDLRHEMTHAIIHASIARVPIWLDEGLAKYFEVPSHERAENHPYMAQVRWNAKFGTIPSLDRLAKLETIDDMKTKEYRDSWAWTHFMIHRSPETHRLLAAYMQMLAKWDGNVEDAAAGRASLFPDGGLFASTVRGREKQAPIPSLKLYLDDIMTNQRETFKEHFATSEAEKYPSLRQ